MSHRAQRDFVSMLSGKFPNNFNNIKMIEVGSLFVNGSIRDFFKDCEYVGYDVGEGNNVDVVYDGINFNQPANTFDTAGSCNCFEHNPHWVSNFKGMHEMLKPDGLLFIAVPTTGSEEHGTTKTDTNSSPLTVGLGWEYYKNLTEEDFREHFNLDEMFSVYKFELCFENTKDLYFYGIKK
jgi:SAM-dependent methyltransferase